MRRIVPLEKFCIFCDDKATTIVIDEGHMIDWLFTCDKHDTKAFS